jgi:hypothetical protein
MQYQLDNCATVAEVLETDKAIRINNDQSGCQKPTADHGRKWPSFKGF